MVSFSRTSRADVVLCLPEITDYETRRGLLHLALRSGRSTTRSLLHLDQLGSLLTYLPLTTLVMRRAARLWADARLKGLPTGPSLDVDTILAAHALEVSDAAVVTDNLRHLGRFVPSYRWQEFLCPEGSVPLVACGIVGNPHAEGFYTACGFELIGTTQTRFGPGLLLRKLL